MENNNPFNKGAKRGKKPLPPKKKFSSTREERGDSNKDKDIEYVSLSGYGITNEGEITRRNYFTFLKEYVNANNDLVMTKEQAIKLQKYMIGLSTGTSAVAPLICAGPRCPYNYCIFTDEENDLDPPLGRSCPIESEIIKQKKMKYIEEYDVNIASMTELALLDELVRIEILEMRITAQLGKEEDATGVSLDVIGADRDGMSIRSRRVSPYLEALEKMSNMKARVIRKMVGDRESKWKRAAALNKKEAQTSADNWAELAELVSEMRDQKLKEASDKAKPIIVDIDKKVR